MDIRLFLFLPIAEKEKSKKLKWNLVTTVIVEFIKIVGSNKRC